MNSALPRMVQPVSSEACLSLISGVLPIAWTTSWLNFISRKTPVVSSGCDPKGPKGGPQATALAQLLSGFCEHDLADVDIPRQESGLAIGEVVFPQAPEAVVETERHQIGPRFAEIVSPC